MDSATLLGLQALASIAFAAAALAAVLWVPSLPGGRLWIAGSVLLASSFTAFALLAVAQSPGLPWVAVANLCGVGAGVALVGASRSTAGLATPSRSAIVASATTALVPTWFTLVRPDFTLRAVTASLVACAFYAVMARALWRAAGLAHPVVLRGASAVVAGAAASHLARAITVPMHQLPADTVLSPETLVGPTLLGCVGFVWLSLTIFVLAGSRVERELDRQRHSVDESSRQLLEAAWADPDTGLATRDRILSVLAGDLRLSAVSPAIACLVDHRGDADGPRQVAVILRDLLGREAPLWDVAGRLDDCRVLVLPGHLGLTHEDVEFLLASPSPEDRRNRPMISTTVGTPGDTVERVLRRLMDPTRPLDASERGTFRNPS